MKIDAKTTCAYTIPTYLEPVPPKLGKVSVKVKAEKKAKPLSSRQKELPSFLQTLESQYAPSLALNNYSDKTFPGMKNAGDVGRTEEFSENKLEFGRWKYQSRTALPSEPGTRIGHSASMNRRSQR